MEFKWSVTEWNGMGMQRYKQCNEMECNEMEWNGMDSIIELSKIGT
jgi:hypothetical protein